MITGETGAGKSVLLAALGLVLGERASSDLVGPWGDEAIVEATFEFGDRSPVYAEVVPLLEDAGLETDEELVVIRRVLTRSGRSRAYINNGVALQKLVAAVAEYLVDLHGQHEHQSLLRPKTYAGMIDHGIEPRILTRYAKAYVAWRELIERLEVLEGDARERRQREDLLRFQIQEIDEASLEPGEDEQIEQRLRSARHAENIRSILAEIDHRLHGDGEREGVLDSVAVLDRRLAEAIKYDESLSATADVLSGILSQMEEVGRDIQTYGDTIDTSPKELEALEERSFRMNQFKRKYGRTVEEILSFRDLQAGQLEGLSGDEREIQALRDERPKCEKALIAAASALHDARTKAATRIAAEVEAHLGQLGMERARFEIAVDWREHENGLPVRKTLKIDPGPRGPDRIAFRLSTIPDRPLADLRDVASGGEVSRIMLALKSVLGRSEGVPTMVFDEIDTGIGGRMSEVVADHLAALAEGEQIICITHLPQIAVRAANSFAVRKSERGKHLVTEIESLSGKQREQEILRMLGAHEDSKSSQQYVRELLKQAGRRAKSGV